MAKAVKDVGKTITGKMMDVIKSGGLSATQSAKPDLKAPPSEDKPIDQSKCNLNPEDQMLTGEWKEDRAEELHQGCEPHPIQPIELPKSTAPLHQPPPDFDAELPAKGAKLRIEEDEFNLK